MENNCVFCDRTKFEERLVGEKGNFWIVATLGQISDGGYLLLIPKRHVSCFGAMEAIELCEMEMIKYEICNVLLKEYGFMPGIIFEHGIVGQTIKHAHLHIIPIFRNITKKIRADFPENEITEIESLMDLRNLYAKRQEPYLLWKDSTIDPGMNQGYKICWNPRTRPEYLRIAVAEAVGRPERGSWRNMDPELDKQLWTETVICLKRYFPRVSPRFDLCSYYKDVLLWSVFLFSAAMLIRVFLL